MSPSVLMPSRVDAGYLERCEEALDRALLAVPGYASWRRFDPGPSCPIDARFAALPALTKADLRQHFPDGFVAPGYEVSRGLESGQIELVHTSGTTEERVTTLWNQAWWDASERASWKLNAHANRATQGNHREAILTCPLSTGVLANDTPLTQEARTLGRFLYLNEFFCPDAWTPAVMDRMLGELDSFRPVVIEANPSFLVRLAAHAVQRGRQPFRPDLIVLTYELPSRVHRRWIERAFGAPVCGSYGSTETGYVFMECEAGRYHQNMAFCRTDFQPWRTDAGGPHSGRVLVTTFDNPWAVMVRFLIGDAVRLATAPCPCGRDDGMVLEAIEGRLRDVTVAPDGHAVTVERLDAALAAVPGIVTYQLEQLAADAYVARLLHDGGTPREQVERDARKALRECYGTRAQVRVEFPARMPQELSGKYRLARGMAGFDTDTLLAEKGAFA